MFDIGHISTFTLYFSVKLDSLELVCSVLDSTKWLINIRLTYQKESAGLKVEVEGFVKLSVKNLSG